MTKKNHKDRNRNPQRATDFEYSRFASTSAYTNKGNNSRATSLVGVRESQLKTMLQDPSKNAPKIADLSISAKNLNGIYKRIMKYLSSILTYDHLIYPIMSNPINFLENPKEMQESYANSAVFMDRLNPKFYLPLFTDKLFTKGVTYQYKLEDKKGVSYQEFPTELCRVGYIEDGVYRFQVDITKLSNESVINYPNEIQKAYSSYQNAKTNNLVEGKWYQVSDKGVAFTLDTDILMYGGMAVPPLANVLIDAIKFENAKDGMEDVAKLDNAKIVHSKIETDSKGRPLMELPVVTEYHNALKRSLPDGSVAITNPFDTTGITLNGTGKDGKFSLLDKTSDQLFKNAGVSGQLFADDNSSSQALERSIEVDCQWLYSFLLPMYANYYNYELKKISKSITWKAKFLSTSYFNRDTAIKTSKDQLTFGGSRLEYLAYTGMTPLEVANMLVFEQRVLAIDEFMIAKKTSNTLGGDSTDGEVGRPKEDNPTDDTVRINDSK